MSFPAHRSPGSPPRIGVALGSGGARGWAHVGVLQRLIELQIPISFIAGTSIGSIMAAAFAADRLDVLESVTYQMDSRRIAQLVMEVGFPRTGLLTGKRIQHLLQEVIGVTRIEDLRIPYAAVAACLRTGEAVVFTQGSVMDAIRASIAIPGIFVPALQNGEHLVDGGIINPLPIDVVEAMGADVVIAVDVNLNASSGHELQRNPETAINPAAAAAAAAILTQIGAPRPVHGAVADAMQRWFRRQTPGLSIFEVLTRSARISENQITRGRLKLHPPAVLIQPAVGSIETLEFHRAIQAIEAGRVAVDGCAEQLKALVSFQ